MRFNNHNVNTRTRPTCYVHGQDPSCAIHSPLTMPTKILFGRVHRLEVVFRAAANLGDDAVWFFGAVAASMQVQ